MIDAIARLLAGVPAPRSAEHDSFSDGLLEYPQYTRPVEFEGMRVPDVLLSGNHKAIAAMRRPRAEFVGPVGSLLAGLPSSSAAGAPACAQRRGVIRAMAGRHGLYCEGRRTATRRPRASRRNGLMVAGESTRGRASLRIRPGGVRVFEGRPSLKLSCSALPAAPSTPGSRRAMASIMVSAAGSPAGEDENRQVTTPRRPGWRIRSSNPS